VQYKPSTCGGIEFPAQQTNWVLNLAKQQESQHNGVNRMLKVNENLCQERFAFLNKIANSSTR